jgi:uncharacterized membrane protein YdjX (TVP38/TMEM64 family)
MQRTHFRLGLLIIVALLIPIVPFAIIGELPGEQWLSSEDDNAMVFAMTGSGILLLDIVLPLPSSVVGTLLGARLGFWPGFFATWLGLTAGHCIGYMMGRCALFQVDIEVSEVPTLLVVFLSRPVPVLAEAMAIAAGASAVPFRHFLVTCMAGNAIYAGVLAANGATLLPGAIMGPGLIIPMLIPVLAWLIWRRSTRQKTEN